jgi:hypothetical protein
MKTKILVLVLVLALSLVVAGVTLADSDIERPRWVLSGGALDSVSGGAALRGTLGQPVVGGVANAGGSVTLGQGFWNGAASGHNVYLPLVIRN